MHIVINFAEMLGSVGIDRTASFGASACTVVSRRDRSIFIAEH